MVLQIKNLKQMECTMRKMVYVNLLLVLSLGLILASCGGGGGDSGGGEEVCTVDFFESDLLGDWVYDGTECAEAPQNSPCDVRVPGDKVNNTLIVRSFGDPDLDGAISITIDGQVHVVYQTVDVNDNTTQGTIDGKMSCDKSRITFNNISWTTSNTGPGEATISRVYTKK
jgi:hypothetical protein